MAWSALYHRTPLSSQVTLNLLVWEKSDWLTGQSRNMTVGQLL